MPNFRGELKLVIMRGLLKTLYGDGHKYLKEAATRLSNRFGVKAYYFQGKYYDGSGYEIEPTSQAVELTPSQTEQLEKIIQQEEEMRAEELVITAYIRRVLNTGNSFGDMKELLPECIHTSLPKINKQSLTNTGHDKITLSQDELQAFLETNESCSNTIKERLITNLLLKDI